MERETLHMSMYMPTPDSTEEIGLGRTFNNIAPLRGRSPESDDVDQGRPRDATHVWDHMQASERGDPTFNVKSAEWNW